VDAAYYEDLAGRLYGLLTVLEDRLGGELAQVFHHFIEVGEYGLALKKSSARWPRTRSPSPSGAWGHAGPSPPDADG
jgi:hypothetical protein